MKEVQTLRVWVYSERKYDELGRVRWEIEWITVKPSAKGNEEIDPDRDTITNVEWRDDEAAALKRAQDIYDKVNGPDGEGLCWGAVTVQKQRLEWFVEEDRVADWENVGDFIEISNFSESAAGAEGSTAGAA